MNIEEIILVNYISAIKSMLVMFDYDLAYIYGYTTKRLNEQVQRNISKFDEDFLFELSEEESLYIRSQNATGSHRNDRYKIKAFTEQGLYMLMTVLKGELAIKQSKALIRFFYI